MNQNQVRVRFAPSPTGGLHIGGVRTALFNYLFAKKSGGKFLLRIEDTDQSRFVPGAEEYIKEALVWCGIIPDESPFHGGPHEPYRQSERSAIYQKYVEQLLENGHAYYAFDSTEELESMREHLKAAGVVNLNYNSATRMSMKNSLTMDAATVEQLLRENTPYVIRLKVPAKEEIRLKDIIRGWVVVHSSTIDDKVLMKSDGLPTYHLANVVDDHLMEITHVIRGEEWLPSAPLHVLLYRYFGWENSMPQFAHLPLILKPDGNGKLSKRAAENAGFPIFPLNWKDPESGEVTVGFKEEGYLPEALINFLCLLGWNSGTDQEIFTIEELISAFSIEKIGKAGTKFDIDKAKWFNQQYIHRMEPIKIGGFLKDELSKQGIVIALDKAISIAQLYQTRITFLYEMSKEALIFFQNPSVYDPQVVAKKWNNEAADAMQLLATAFEKNTSLSDGEQVKQIYHDTLSDNGINPGKMMQLLRLCVSGVGSGPDLMPMIAIMGGKEVAKRIQLAINTLTPVSH